MKTLGILILAAGVGLCAAFGARLSDGMFDRTRLEGRVALLDGQAAKARGAYCEARKTAQLPEGECAPPKQAEPPADAPLEATEEGGEAAQADKKAAAPAPPTYEQALATEQAAVAALRAAPADLPPAVAEARAAWIDARAASIEPKAQLASTVPPGPQARLAGWFELSGMPFLGGLALIVIGAVLGRRAAKAELHGDGDRKPGAAKRVDFAVAVDELTARIRALADRAAATDAPTAAEQKALHADIQELQVARFGPIIEARHQLQNRIGLAGFASVFSPLSSGERWLNRAWSTLADAHWPETQTSLAQSAEQMAEASRALAEELKKAA